MIVSDLCEGGTNAQMAFKGIEAAGDRFAHCACTCLAHWHAIRIRSVIRCLLVYLREVLAKAPIEALAFSQGLYIGLTTGQPVVLSPVLGGPALHSALIKYCTDNKDDLLQAAAEGLRRSSKFLGPP